ncbi:hypothetical protein ACFL1R_12235 [Candidatus Latescibacterota bacterium]
MKEKKWFAVTRSPEEDIALVSIVRDTQSLTLPRFVVLTIMSVAILGIYILMNHLFFPGYPVITPYTEKHELFAENYPPFRMNEWITYSITQDIIHGKLYDEQSFSCKQPIGFPLLAVPLTKKFGEIGLYYTNAFVLWISALVFFFLMMEIVGFNSALGSTLLLAFATPNLFYASSAFAEPTGQLVLVLAIYFFIRGFTVSNDWIYFILCGFIMGLNLFVQPFIVLSVILLIILLMNERGRWTLVERSVMCLGAGFLVPLIAFLAINKVYLGNFSGYIYSSPWYVYDIPLHYINSGESNIITGIWKLIFNSPQGLINIMPVAMLFPLGLMIMWREELRMISVFVGIILLFAVLMTAGSPFPVTGDGLWSRQLVCVLPLLVIPLAFLWRKHLGEKIWFTITLVLTIYMSGFSWWAGPVRGKWMSIGVLHDSNARYIMLSRKNKLKRQDFISSKELLDTYFDSLEKHDMKSWLDTLEPDVISEIYGFEREVFAYLCQRAASQEVEREQYIETSDPDKGIRPVLPDLGLFVRSSFDIPSQRE